jgi:hypothetical protein
VPPRNARALSIWYRLSARHPERYRGAAAGSRDGGGPGRGGVLTRAILDTFPLIAFGAPRAEAETQMEAKDQDFKAYGNRLSSMLGMQDIQSDVPATSSAGPETPHLTTVADVGAQNDHSRRVHDDDPELADLPPAWRRARPSSSTATTSGPAARVDRPRHVLDLLCIVDLKMGKTYACCRAKASMSSIRCASTHGCSSSRARVRLTDTVRMPAIHNTPLQLLIAYAAFFVRFPGTVDDAGWL